MSRAQLRREDISDDMPLRLDVAAELAFPDGSITLSSLRNEARKGRLAVWRVANKDMTTLAEIRRMMERCRVNESLPASGSDQPRKDGRPSGSSKTEASRSAQGAEAALRKRVEEQKQRYRTTSPGSTTPSQKAAPVIHPKFR